MVMREMVSANNFFIAILLYLTFLIFYVIILVQNKRGVDKMYSILAGIMISLGCIINLQVGGIGGALFFSIGLITILMLNFDLFTGRASLLATNRITWKRIGLIWLGNLYGCAMVAAALSLTPLGATLGTAAQTITTIRLANGPLANITLGGCCGILVLIYLINRIIQFMR